MINKEALSGTLEFIGFADILQLLAGNAVTGVLKIKNDIYGEAYIFFSKGEVVNAAHKDFEDKKAFFIPFSWETGTFVFEEQEIESERKISHNITGLILEGLRLVDEGVLKRSASQVRFDSGAPVLRGPLIDYSEIVDEEFFEKDEFIVKEGRYGSWIWVILDGLVLVEKCFAGKCIPVTQLGRGAFIGNLAAFARGDRSRSASVRALSPVQLGVLDAQALSKEYTAYSDFLRNFFICMDNRLRKITEAYTKFYIEGKNISKELRSHTGLMKERFKDNKIGIIESGTCSLIFEAFGHTLDLGVIDKGSLVGELPFVDKDKDINFYLKGDDKFAIRPYDRKFLLNEFKNMSLNVKKMLEFAGLSFSATAYNLALNFKNEVKE